MARPSRGASRSLDAPLACVAAPAPELSDLGEGLLGVGAFETGLGPLVDVPVQWFRSGLLDGTTHTTAGDLANFGITFQTDGIDDWTAVLVLPGGGSYCVGPTAPSNDVNFG